MISRPANWSNVREYSSASKLPVGAYVCRIIRAEVQNNSYGNCLLVYFDIAEGEYANFYDDQYNANTRDNKKWRGVYRQFIPKDDGSDKDEWTKSHFKALVTAIEKSNRGYTWDWNEFSLAGKLVGFVFRNEEWAFNGHSGWSVKPFRPCSVDTVIDGDYEIPKDKPLKKAAPASTFSAFDDDGGELPF